MAPRTYANPARLPRKSAANTETALRNLAVAKILIGRAKEIETQAKRYLSEKALSEGDKTHARLPKDAPNGMAGLEIATVSLTKQGAPSPKITDPDAFYEWAVMHAPAIAEAAKMRPVFPEYITASKHLAMLIENHGGEIPDGVEMSAGRAPTVMVRMSEEQEQNLMKAIGALHDTVALLEKAVIDVE